MKPDWRAAARAGDAAALERLLGSGYDIDAKDEHGNTALMLAVLNGRVEIVRALVEAGADLSVRGSGAPGFHSKTALDLAVAREGDPTDTRQGESIADLMRAVVSE